MFVVVTFRKSTLFKIIFPFAMVVVVLLAWRFTPIISSSIVTEEQTQLINDVFTSRNNAMLEQDLEAVEKLYDKGTKFGLWAYEFEGKKMKYIKNWSEKQGIIFTDIRTNVVVRRAKGNENSISANFIASTEYDYTYMDEPDKVNTFRIGTYHTLQMVKKDERWVIVKEWYKDPFGDSLRLDNIKSEEARNHITGQKERVFIDLNQRRSDAVEYADKYCGAAASDEYGYKYNKKYKDYNPLGGDCANFASQILYEGGKFKKNRTWNYTHEGSRAWVNAHGFKDYMVNSGRASVIAYGDYSRVLKASYKLLPGDFVAYEKDGDINHISVVTGADSKGYSLVNCHNTDRYRVPWDLGFSNKNIKFWLVRVHY